MSCIICFPFVWTKWTKNLKALKKSLTNVTYSVKGGGEMEEERVRRRVVSNAFYSPLPLLLWCLFVLLSVWMIEVSNEAVMAAGQLKTHCCCDVAQTRLTEAPDWNICFCLKQIVAGQDQSGSSNILIGCFSSFLLSLVLSSSLQCSNWWEVVQGDDDKNWENKSTF